MGKSYICIDLKSFYASVECIERKLDPMTTNLVVADSSRTEKTICLAVTPSLKAYGISGRARLFEVVSKLKEINNQRRISFGKNLIGKSADAAELENDASLEASYIAAPPRMALYIEYSTRIFEIYLKYVSRADILDYSIDEVFIDATDYLKAYKMSAYELAVEIIKDISKTIGITATAGVGTNMYLAKVAMDIVAKKIPANEDGVRVACLDEAKYKRLLWTHTPITDFWRVGRGYANKLKTLGLYTMGDIARYSLDFYGEKKLYEKFGVNAELLIDHAWGIEPCTFEDIRSYKPENKSLGSGQVLHCPYDYWKARLIVWEMTELLSLNLVEKKLVTNQIVLTVGYDIESVKNYKGEITTDYYGRRVPKPAHGTANVSEFTSSTAKLTNAVLELYDKIVDNNLLVRRINISVNHLISEDEAPKSNYEQLDLFTKHDEQAIEQEAYRLERERKIQETTIEIKNRFGKNAILKGVNLQEGATTKQRNKQIGGHKA